LRAPTGERVAPGNKHTARAVILGLCAAVDQGGNGGDTR